LFFSLSGEAPVGERGVSDRLGTVALGTRSGSRFLERGRTVYRFLIRATDDDLVTTAT
jgi:hypothetical protein